jgi:hypothetical protein
VKKLIQKAVILLTLTALLISTAITASAKGTVTYDGEAQNFIFAPGSTYSPTDLFENFKNVMPGDSLTQQITVKNDASDQVYVKIYLRSQGATEETTEFLSQLKMTVALSADSATSQLFDAAADQTDGLTDWVLLGTLYSGGEVNLDVTLTVPIELGNEYQNALGEINWQFKVEEYPVEKDDPTESETPNPGQPSDDTTKPNQTGTASSPKTGDTAQIGLYCGLLVGSVGLLICIFVLAKKKKDQAND